MIDHPQAYLTIPTLQACIEHQVNVVVCDVKHMPLGMWLPLYGHSQATLKIQNQVNASKPMNKNIWQRVIASKLKNQAKILEKRGIDVAYLKKLSAGVRSGDTANAEAQGAAWYWKRLIPIKGFVRDRFGESPNQILNYGYIILRSAVARGLVLAGLLPIIGINHRNQYNPFCLADDMMEPFRPLIDQHILHMIDSEKFGEQAILELEISVRKEILDFLLFDVDIAGHKSPVQNAIITMCRSLSKCYDESSIQFLELPDLL